MTFERAQAVPGVNGLDILQPLGAPSEGSYGEKNREKTVTRLEIQTERRFRSDIRRKLLPGRVGRP